MDQTSLPVAPPESTARGAPEAESLRDLSSAQWKSGIPAILIALLMPEPVGSEPAGRP